MMAEDADKDNCRNPSAGSRESGPLLCAVDMPSEDPQGNDRLRLGISSCLLGERVRFDGGHKHDGFLTDQLGPYVEWVPVCPELEVGMGVPREAVRLEGDPEAPRMVGVRSRRDHTIAMRRDSSD
jgi:uncharacterized protein YbbK (DUF523 family)